MMEQKPTQMSDEALWEAMKAPACRGPGRRRRAPQARPTLGQRVPTR
jgi:hypothetical protein